MAFVDATPLGGANASGHRIEYLDGLRGLAILLVIGFHAYSRWPDVVPYGDAFAGVPLFRNGWLGVQLFFLISGYVIFMTLDKCSDYWQFLWRRWIRLFPAMLVCSLVIWATAALFPERPAGPVSAWQLIPGLSFVDPIWWSRIGVELSSIEGAFWSIFVEVQFYLIAGASYFFFGGRKGALAVLLALFAASHLLDVALKAWPALAEVSLLRRCNLLLQWAGVPYYGWFAGGALFYTSGLAGSRRVLGLAIAVSLTAAITEHGAIDRGVTAAAVLIALLFTAAILSERVQNSLSNAVLLTTGYISYPLYLLHENLMVAGIVKLGRWAPFIPPLLLPVIPVLLIAALAWVVAARIEPLVRGVIRKQAAAWRARSHAILSSRV